MNKYWSNEDDGKVSYITEHPVRDSRADGGAEPPRRRAVPARADEEPSGALSNRQRLDRPENSDAYPGERAAAPDYGTDRSSFIAEEMNAQRGGQFAPPPRYAQPQQETQPDPYVRGGVYRVQSEEPQDSNGGRGGKRGWLVFWIILLSLALIAGGAYVFRYQILDLVGDIFGEEAVWKIVPTPAPTEFVPDVPAYVGSAELPIKTRAMQEINAVAGGFGLETDIVTEQNIVLRNENQDGTFDYYLFASDSGRLLGYYEKLRNFIPCGKAIFHIDEDPYLITSGGLPLVDPAAFARGAGADVQIKPMVNGWAMVSDARGTTFNYVGDAGALISGLWFAKAFPFTADTTLAYVDTGNLTNAEARYALYLLMQDGGTKRLSYLPDMDGVLESVCGMAFMSNGEMRAQDEDLTLIDTTDDAAAYVNCGALAVRDPATMLYGLFVGGVQQYPFAFDEIKPMPSDLAWAETVNGYVRRYTVTGQAYPLPRSYSFILKQGDTEQIVSIAAVSEYPIVLD